jgi:hypothetical protein
MIKKVPLDEYLKLLINVYELVFLVSLHNLRVIFVTEENVPL